MFGRELPPTISADANAVGKVHVLFEDLRPVRPANEDAPAASLSWLDVAPQVFKKLDKDNDKRLSDKELDLSELKEFKGKEALAAAHIKVLQLELRERNRIQEESKQRPLGVELNESLVDRSAIFLRMAEREKKDLKRVVKDSGMETLMFSADKFDLDKSGEISKAELEKSLSDAKPEQKAALRFMIQNYEVLRKFNNPDSTLRPNELSPGAITSFLIAAENHDRWGLSRRTEHLAHKLRTYIKPGTDAFPASKTVRDAISSNAVVQGSVGDCYFMAALSLIADKAPDSLSKMIERKGADQYVVKFPGAPDRPITCSISQTESIVFAAGTKSGAWPTILEKAFAELSRQDKRFQARVFAEKLPGAEALDLGGSEQGLIALTGKVPVIADRDFDKPDDTKALAKALDEIADKTKNVIGIAHSGFDFDSKKLPRGHVFAILKADEKSVTIRNPWGVTSDPEIPGSYKDDKSNGVQTISREEFLKLFDRIAYVDMK